MDLMGLIDAIGVGEMEIVGRRVVVGGVKKKAETSKGLGLGIELRWHRNRGDDWSSESFL